MTDTHQSFIPVPRKRLSLQSPANALELMAGPTPSSPRNAHRRNRSLVLSSGDEGHRSPRATSRISHAHVRLVTAVEGVGVDAVSPQSTVISLDGTTTNGTDVGTDDDESAIDSVDRLRAPTRSSLNKQKKNASSNGKHVRRRSMIPDAVRADERLGLSRIPRAAVTHAVSLHAHQDRSPTLPIAMADIESGLDNMAMSISPGELGAHLLPTDSPSPPTCLRDPLTPVVGAQNVSQNASRIPSGPHGKSTRMIAALQTELEHTKTHLDRVKQEVRNCRREIGTLTRRSEDLRETRDRMRTEAETLQNVISRKERMVADVLARARTAEASATQNATDRKDLEARVKKAETDARAEVEAATAARVKAESEAVALRDSVRSLREVWAREVARYKVEVQVVQTQMRSEREAAAKKHDAVLAIVREQSAEHKNIIALVDEVKSENKVALETFDTEVRSLRASIERSTKETADARNLAKTLAEELARLRRFARQPSREDLNAIIAAEFGTLDVSSPDYPSPAPTPALSSPAGVLAPAAPALANDASAPATPAAPAAASPQS